MSLKLGIGMVAEFDTRVSREFSIQRIDMENDRPCDVYPTASIDARRCRATAKHSDMSSLKHPHVKSKRNRTIANTEWVKV